MNKALFAALASVALLGASCSVQEFTPVVLDDSNSSVFSSTASIAFDTPFASAATPNPNGYLSTAFTTGKYSFRYGLLSPNLFDMDKLVFGYEVGNGGVIRENSDYKVTQDFVKCSASTTYSKSNSTNDSFQVYTYRSDGTYIGRVASWSDATFTTSSDAAFFRFESTWKRTRFMLVEGSSQLTYQPFSYGVSVDTPFLKAPRTFNLPLDGDCKPDGQFTYNGYTDDGFQWMFKYGYEYVDAAHPRTTQTCIGMTFVSEEQRDVFLGQFTDRALPRREYSNCTYKDYELSAIDATDGHCGLYLYFRPVFFSNQYVASYMSFDTGNFDDGYSNGYDVGYNRGFQEGYMFEIVRDLERFEFVYYTGTGDAEESHSVVKNSDDAKEYVKSYTINGLLSIRSVVANLTDGVNDAHDIVIRLKYDEAKAIDAAPLYIDYESFTSLVAQEFRTDLAVFSQSVQVPWYVFNSSLEVSYQGNLAGYSTGLLSDRYIRYTDIQINYPMPDVGGRLNYIGILSGYAQGYADAMTESGERIDDLTQRILDLQEDLEQYQGKTYEQIYNLGVQAGLDENAQGAATFNSLFGNILTAPLTILNGLTDISFFGMPILTAILSLLMVAMALFLFKRFK